MDSEVMTKRKCPRCQGSGLSIGDESKPCAMCCGHGFLRSYKINRKPTLDERRDAMREEIEVGFDGRDD